ncbi:MAG TPA: MurT ligase domain-containing protein [Acidimicrobiales bacterium]|nr:MurT ligase domain-containing protein [Acidimicrobiales bacterium]
MATSTRTRIATALGGMTSATSRLLRRGEGAVIGAKVTLALAPHALDELAAGRRIAVVSGTNGKSTTTAMLAAACTAGGSRVASNIEGANLRSGVVSLLGSRRARDTDLAVLEIDELALPSLLPSFERPLVVLLNLSRDQLDRFGEVRTVAAEWRRALGAQPVTVVANADDPLVVYGAAGADDVTYIGVGLRWQQDSASCPNCGQQIRRTDRDWWCECGFRRPPALEVDGDTLAVGEVSVALHPGVPGQYNVGNAALAVVAATKLGVPLDVAVDAIKGVTSVAGRYRTVTVGSTSARLLLAKNPAGWGELLAMIEGNARPLVLAINARIADGKDPSWLWDVEFERVRGRRVIAAGERAADLAVRLRYAEVECEVWDGPVLDAADRFGAPEVDVLVNYTVFAEIVRGLDREQ